MTDLLEKAVQTARALPPKEQDDIARIVLMIAGEDQPVIQLTPEEKTSFAKSRTEAARQEFATDDQVQAVWSKHNL